MSSPQSIAHYRITSKLGQGGMGEVWRAADTKLNREVAIKILPDVFANDLDRMARFEREAQVLASLNHPGIAAIYGVEERALVMELVEGPTLDERIAAGPIPITEAVPLAKQIAEALEYAHERGVIHRDLKPSNIKITPEGQLKVLDFGLAAVAGPPADAETMDPRSSPTLTMQATMAGLIMGTAAYMSPEQASGKKVDKRSDIWSFGVVLWEMLTARQLFSGETISHTLADVLRAEIDLTKLPPETPPAIRQLLRRCLERDVKDRLRDIGEARVLLSHPLTQPAATERKVRPPRSALAPWIVAMLLAIAGAILATIHFREAPPPAQLMRYSVPAPDSATFASWLALSPDGRHLGFTATGADGLTRVWIRSLDSLESRPLFGTEGVNTFFWSPDSRFVAFGTGTKLKKIEISGGAAQTVCDFPAQVLGGSWNASGVILFGGNIGPIQRVAAAGGESAPVSALDPSREEITHSYPTFLPDGKHFIYLRRTVHTEKSGVYLGTLDVEPAKQNLTRIQSAQFAPGYVSAARPSVSGRLLFLREGSLMAQSFDERRLEAVGDPVVIVDQVGTSLSRAAYSISNGVLAYRIGISAARQLSWFDRQGTSLGRAGQPSNLTDVALSPDGERVAHTDLSPQIQVWVLDLVRGANTRLSFAAEGAQAPAWSPDGKRIAFSSYVLMRGGQSALYIKDASNGGAEEAVLRSIEAKYLNDWSRDGRFLVYSKYDRESSKIHLWALPLDAGPGERKPIQLVDSNFNEQQGQVSPDSRWLAYSSDVSGKSEIYVRPFPTGDGRTGQWLVSTDGGVQPRWRSDGKELFYVGQEGKLMAVDVTLAAGQLAFKSGGPHALFATAHVTLSRAANLFEYDVSRDGQRFLILERAAGATSAPVTVVLNWEAGLKK